ncbi:MAG: leucyl/phenylalanyl-tRNA--protein transferase [Balneolaceae bacterium]|nr:MAG: leucyl/phenylalanyl-tRNA--protein transferase [Balneolaceae bacterium]
MGIIHSSILLEAYRMGIFPMADSGGAEEVNWYSAKKRGIIPLDGFRLSKRDLRSIRSAGFSPGINRDFKGVIEGCAARESTWISENLKKSFIALHELGSAHSVEVYLDEKLAGGLYGVAIGGAFFAESMFQAEKDAMKAALLFCHRHLAEHGFVLWDVQFYTDHLGRFGCVEISARAYEMILKDALKIKAAF